MRRSKSIFFVLMFAILTSHIFSQVQPVKIDLYSNGNKLHAEIYQTPGDHKYPAVILLHGYPGGEGDQFDLGKKLSLSGINVLIFNFQGTWSSEGIFSFEHSMEDIGAAIEFLNEKNNVERFHIDTSNIVVAGYSFGGAMALTAAIYNPEIKRIISIAGGDEAVFGRKMLSDNKFRIMFEQMLKASESPEGPVKCDTKSYIDFWLANIDTYDQVKHAESLAGKDILLLGGWQDENIVLEEHILPLYRKLREFNSEKLFIVAFDTDHGFGNVREELSNTIEVWIKQKE